MRTYQTHNNGDRPFLVEIQDKTIKVYDGKRRYNLKLSEPKITDESLGNAVFDGDAPTFNTMMKVKDTIHKGKQLTANISKNERG